MYAYVYVRSMYAYIYLCMNIYTVLPEKFPEIFPETPQFVKSSVIPYRDANAVIHTKYADFRRIFVNIILPNLVYAPIFPVEACFLPSEAL